MAEPFGVAASVFGVVSLTIEITKIVVQFGLDWKDAPKDVKGFKMELESLRTALLETANLMSNKNFANAFVDRPPALLSHLEVNTSSTAETKLSLEECKRELKEFLNGLKKRVSGHRLGWERFKAPFLTKDTIKVIEKLHRQCRIFNQMVSIDTATLVATTYNEVKEIRKEQQEWYQIEENQRILAWLSHLNFDDKQDDIFSRHHPGTGEWFLALDEFKQWRDGNTSTTLWCPGIPGAGKSVMTSIVVNNLKSMVSGVDIAIGFIYCDYKDGNNQTTSNLLSSLVKQLVLQCKSIPRVVKECYVKHDNRQSPPSLDESSMMLSFLLEDFRTSFIIIDALDEHLNEQEDINMSRKNLIRYLQDLQQHVRGSTYCKLLLTSREILNIEKQLINYTRVDIHATESDIRSYLNFRISSSKFRFASHMRNEAHRASIVDRLVQSAQGMFLLPRLYLDHLGSQTSLRGVRDALNRLPTKLDDIYNDAMVRIKGQGEADSKLALRALSWVSNAFRPLQLRELQHALAVELEDIDFDEDGITDESLLVSVCAGLITVDVQSNQVRLVHTTVQEYFEKTKEKWFSNSQKEITETCLTYLLFDAFGEGRCLTDEKRKNRLQQYPFYEYAARNWGNHIRGDPEESVQMLALRFLTDSVKVASSTQILLLPSLGTPRYTRNANKIVLGIHLAAFFCLKTILKYLFQGNIDVDIEDCDNQTPLFYAAKYGYEEMAQMLLERNARVNARDKWNNTPLFYAAINGHSTVMQTLLSYGAEIDAQNQSLQTPLYYAASGGHSAAVQILLTQKPQIDIRDALNQTPLMQAAFKGHDQIVRKLLDCGAEINAKNKWDETALSYAAKKGHEDVVRTLLKHPGGAEIIGVKDTRNQTPLLKAVKNKHGGVVKVLLEYGAAGGDTEGGNIIDQTSSLAFPTEKGDKEEGEKDEGQTTLLSASKEGYEEVVKLVLEFGTSF
ncbi:MAG: hypothetical protein M1834_000606 [Cirrosporium novae-zelandiae]|nr:MAG: hypothetical protein M1834_000606 [Cirrosporium novae-zelandiae]